MSEQCPVVPTVHQPQDLVAAALQRDMEMWHKRSAMGAIIDKRIVEKVGFETTDAKTPDAFNLIERPNQVDKTLTSSSSEVAYIHSGKYNFLSALTGSLFGLRH